MLSSLRQWSQSPAYRKWITAHNLSLIHIFPALLKNPEYKKEFTDLIYQMEEDAFTPEVIDSVFAKEEERMHDEAAYDFQSEAFTGYLMYSVNSSPLEEKDYITMEAVSYTHLAVIHISLYQDPPPHRSSP